MDFRWLDAMAYGSFGIIEVGAPQLGGGRDGDELEFLISCIVGGLDAKPSVVGPELADAPVFSAPDVAHNHGRVSLVPCIQRDGVVNVEVDKGRAEGEQGPEQGTTGVRWHPIGGGGGGARIDDGNEIFKDSQIVGLVLEAGSKARIGDAHGASSVSQMPGHRRFDAKEMGGLERFGAPLGRHRRRLLHEVGGGPPESQVGGNAVEPPAHLGPGESKGRAREGLPQNRRLRFPEESGAEEE
ncbi:hypothetical protein DCS_06084 [Drechmeria coniospora]|uniref:Uncharacterized protein n=1 Tax=Drechmeria coniospora TaxID=98403 RepID=A0A151GAM2_DRECN|nr:hypothetical protein DCS_06084 [Drechmeria coniospora]KYK54127.1 hypothetical protein DCS_06084 [Drechmeria coniospora]